MYEDKVLISIKTSHTATFDKQGSSIEDKILDNFININAPAIIFPFVREEIASLTSKAGVGGVLIQPVNFVELNNNRIANLKKASEL
ncbi:MAG: protein-export chaperone SecB [Bacteroidetes bacterium]|nr:protein-export chaperone SecB [Bacteroidota bacterium]